MRKPTVSPTCPPIMAPVTPADAWYELLQLLAMIMEASAVQVIVFLFIVVLLFVYVVVTVALL